MIKTQVLVAIVIITLGQFKIADSRSSSITDGRDIYVRECGDCHSQTLRGTAHGVSLLGTSFIEKWKDRSLDSLIDYTRKTMPPGGSVSLNDQDYTSILNYILGQNREFIDSDSVLLAVNDSLVSETTSWSGAEEVAAMASKVAGFENRPIDDLANVSLDDLYLP
ncbi:MAG: cytochrome c [Halieaceae bacterium]|nr:cytochrome c [Halieaceae bacterium]